MITIILICAGMAILTGAVVFLTIRIVGKSGEEEKNRTYLFGLPGDSETGSRMLKDAPASMDEYDDLMDRLVGLFETEKVCLKPNVRISDVAASLAVGKGTLSRAIKIKTGKNFCQLIHHYRVREAMRIYANHPNLTVKEISHRVGFNSQTTFITAFGRHTGSTPAEWCRQYKQRNNKDYGGRKSKQA